MLHIDRSRFKGLAYIIGVGLTFFQILFTGGFFVIDTPLLRGVHLSIVMVLVFLLFPISARYKGVKEPWFLVAADLLCCLIAAATVFYFMYELENLLERIRYVDEVTNVDLFFGTATILLVLEVTRRTSGMPLVTVCLCFLLYALFGQHLPASIGHNGISYDRLIEMQFLLQDGIYGTCLSVGATMIFAFIMFGAFLERSGMSSLFMDLACLLTKRSRGGPAKVAIFASALFGTISGSSPANVYSTGIFTIPLMKRVGYDARFAGAVEAVASTGGQVMPPVMGAAAFIMADLTGLGYLPVATAAVLPALLYYLGLLAMIHFEALRKNIGCLPPEMVPETKKVLRKLYYLGPICILILSLWMGRSVINSAFIATLSIVILSFFNKETRMGGKALLDAMELSARNTLMISACCAAAGIIVGVITISGIGFKFISMITDLAGGNLFLLMGFLALTCIVLGMGVPTAPAYVIVATLGAPALMKAGVPMLAAHLFVFYYAILSVITPPVCVTAFAGASIAGANPMETGYTSAKLAVVAFVIPFMFVLQPALLWQGALMDVILATATAIVGVVGIAAAMQGYLLTHCTLWERPLLFLGGIVLVYPGLKSDLAGIGLLSLVVILQLVRRSAQAAPARSHRAG